jgi:hypothetical protein
MSALGGIYYYECRGAASSLGESQTWLRFEVISAGTNDLT